jgi:prepilin-type N-terminal cleavage/methylation domain-containing protein
MNHNLTHHKKRGKGFTLIELLVVMSLIGLITSIVIFNQSSFSDRLALSNAVNDIELTIREAQVYGIGVREFIPTSNEFSVSYGVSINLNNSGSSNNSYIYFADRSPTNGFYNTPTTCVADGSSECIQRLYLNRGNVITTVCAIPSSGPEQCSPGVGRIDITFIRPNPNAQIVFFNNSGTQINFVNPIGARIEILSPKGSRQSVVVYRSGQIAIQ